MPLETPALLEAMIRDSDGVAVTYGADSTYGHFETADGRSFDPPVIGVVRHVTVATGRIENPTQDSAITVDGISYTVRDHERVDGGALTRIYLKG